MSGFLNIGFVENRKEYSKQLKERSEQNFYNYKEFDDDIDKKWKEKKDGIIRCFNLDLDEVGVKEGNIAFFSLKRFSRPKKTAKSYVVPSGVKSIYQN